MIVIAKEIRIVASKIKLSEMGKEADFKNFLKNIEDSWRAVGQNTERFIKEYSETIKKVIKRKVLSLKEITKALAEGTKNKVQVTPSLGFFELTTVQSSVEAKKKRQVKKDLKKQQMKDQQMKDQPEETPEEPETPEKFENQFKEEVLKHPNLPSATGLLNKIWKDWSRNIKGNNLIKHGELFLNAIVYSLANKMANKKAVLEMEQVDKLEPDNLKDLKGLNTAIAETYDNFIPAIKSIQDIWEILEGELSKRPEKDNSKMNNLFVETVIQYIEGVLNSGASWRRVLKNPIFKTFDNVSDKLLKFMKRRACISTKLRAMSHKEFMEAQKNEIQKYIEVKEKETDHPLNKQILVKEWIDLNAKDFRRMNQH